MAFRPPPKIFEKVMRFKALKFEEGGALTLWGIPSFVIPLHTQIYLLKLIEKDCGAEEAKHIFYNLGKFQAKTGFDIINKRFGYAKTLEEKRRLLEFNTGQTELLGLGAYKFVRMDFKNDVYVVVGNSPFAEGYKKFFGLQKSPVDYFFAGACAGAVQASIEKDVVAIEVKCMAQGHNQCEFMIKTRENWKNDPLSQKHSFFFRKAPSIQELGSRLKQLLVLR
ncbi:MAG TPA: V4R domain-containing protein [Candidatus Nanoarchaeia archaeon]|nr:V4R domain-containing protein [Candidatus Nanoarchaeia archaeon]